MSYGLLWIETLLACVLFAAMPIPRGLRCKRRMAMIAMCGLGILPPLVPLGILVALTSAMRFVSGIHNGTFMWAVLLVICYVVGLSAIVVFAVRRDEGGIRRAFFWPVGRIAAAWLVVLSLVVMTCWNIELQAQVEIQALRSEAGALALSVLPPPMADSANAAGLYGQAEERLKAANIAGDEGRDYRMLEPRSPEVGAYLQRQQRTLEIIRRAADMGACRFDYDYAKPDLEVMLSEVSSLQRSAYLLGIAARAEAAAGNVDLALADCRRMYGLGGHLASSPLLISGLASFSTDAKASKIAAQVLPWVTSSGQLEAFAAPDPGGLSRMLVHILRGEEAYNLASFCDFAGGKFGNQAISTWSKRAGVFSWLAWVRDDVGTDRELMEHMRQLARQPHYEAASALEQLEKNAQNGVGYGLMTRRLSPSLLHTFGPVAEAQALRSAVAVACAATRYRLDHGEYPAMGSALMPKYLEAIPVDPFDGKPLRLKKNSDGSVVIYSVGSNGVDDGGEVESSGKGKHAGDLGIVLKVAGGY